MRHPRHKEGDEEPPLLEAMARMLAYDGYDPNMVIRPSKAYYRVRDRLLVEISLFLTLHKNYTLSVLYFQVSEYIFRKI